METQQIQAIKQLVDIAERRKVLLICCIFLSTIIGITVYLLLPKWYMSSCLLSYQQEKINPTSLSPELNTTVKEILSTSTQIVLSRTNLEEIITAEGLFQKEVNSANMEDVVNYMRGQIAVIPSNEGNAFSLTYMERDPDKVARVTNLLALRFIGENIKNREERAVETSTYTKDELGMVQDLIDAKEAVMRDYKLKNYNQMSEQLETNTERVIALQAQYQSTQRSIQEMENSRALLQDRLILNRQLTAAQMRVDSKTTSQAERSVKTLAQLQAQLRELQTRYTDQHPKIKSITKEIANFDQTIDNNNGKNGSTEIGMDLPSSNEHLELQNNLRGIGANIAKLNNEKDELKASIKKYEGWITATPVKEAEWSALTREYGELKRRYDFLVGQNLQADSALNLERRQKGSQFKIEDPARKPEIPVKPRFLIVMGIALMAGCGLGGGLALGLEHLDSSFRDPAKLEETLKLGVICSVPHLSLPSEIARQRKRNLWEIAFFLLCGLVIIAVIISLWMQGRLIL
jgi:polysaccharide chain length determinant protein (PEP-CTERM system associated)